MDEDFLQHLFGFNREYFQRPSHEENLEDVEDDLAKIAPRLKWYQRKNVSLKILGLVEDEDGTDDETVDEPDREMSKGPEEKAKAEGEVEGEIEEWFGLEEWKEKSEEFELKIPNIWIITSNWVFWCTHLVDDFSSFESGS